MGGKETNKPRSKRVRHAGHGVDGKTIVLGLKQRDGQVRAGVIDNIRSGTLYPIVKQHVAKGSTVYTDEHSGYNNLRYDFDHQRVSHKKGEYVRGSATTNGIKSIWALFKRQYVGTHHWISPKHMDAYLNEMTFRLNRRDLDKGQRHDALLSQIEGPMPWKVLVACEAPKPERSLFLDMEFGEALARYAQTKPDEVRPAPGQKKKAARPGQKPKPDDPPVEPAD